MYIERERRTVASVRGPPASTTEPHSSLLIYNLIKYHEKVDLGIQFLKKTFWLSHDTFFFFHHCKNIKEDKMCY